MCTVHIAELWKGSERQALIVHIGKIEYIEEEIENLKNSLKQAVFHHGFLVAQPKHNIEA